MSFNKRCLEVVMFLISHSVVLSYNRQDISFRLSSYVVSYSFQTYDLDLTHVYNILFGIVYKVLGQMYVILELVSVLLVVFSYGLIVVVKKKIH